MVFEPTFEQIDQESVALPDQTGADPDVDRTESDGGLDDAARDDADDQDGAVEGDAAASISSGDVTANDLPPYGN